MKAQKAPRPEPTDEDVVIQPNIFTDAQLDALAAALGDLAADTLLR